MNRIAVILIASVILASCGNNPASQDTEQTGWLVTPSLQAVTVTDDFWKPIIDRNRTITIPYIFEKCEETGRIDNFAIAGGLKKGKHTGERYNDSDVFKIIEGACYSLLEAPDPELRAYADSLVTLVAEAQEDDGYLYTTRTIDPLNMAPGAGRERWIDERVSHELYNVGHMYEAAVAHYMATGSDRFLNVAIRNAELVATEFGWGLREIAPGHQEIELGLIKLHELTGNTRWLELARFFIDVRGRQEEYLRHPKGSRFEVYNDSVYLQMHLPVLDQKEAVGHAVRGAYMYTAMADLSRVTGDDRYLEASERIWKDVLAGKIYITGGIGSKEHGEAFGEPFELPNMDAYTETCASVANVFWNHRLYSATGEARYLDVLERTLYNGLISGIGLDGCSFFYTNPLESDGRFERAGWFQCSCCPGNVARFLPAMKQYIWSETATGVNLNLFIGSEARLKTPAGEAEIGLETSYPRSGDIKLTILPENNSGRFTLGIRIPSWTGDAPMEGGLYSYLTPATGKVVVRINGKRIKTPVIKGFALLDREWKMGDVVQVSLPVEPRFIVARDEVEANRGRVALGTGPIVWCLEEADNGPVREVIVDPSVKPEYVFEQVQPRDLATLTFPVTGTDGPVREAKAVPYYSWANRGKGEMIVWMKTKQ
ncbi:MAG TPA: glycoside hydrolase family 127 protein [Bacteroidales bacterium]|nr:glycoside hydrolase family 127 protein [Bacteroidales bacterium]